MWKLLVVVLLALWTPSVQAGVLPDPDAPMLDEAHKKKDDKTAEEKDAEQAAAELLAKLGLDATRDNQVKKTKKKKGGKKKRK